MTPSLHHMVFTLLNKHPGVLQNDHFYLSSGKHVMAESFEVSDRWFPAVNWTALTWRNNIVGSMCAYRLQLLLHVQGFLSHSTWENVCLQVFFPLELLLSLLKPAKMILSFKYYCISSVAPPSLFHALVILNIDTTLQQHNPWKTCCTSAFTRHSLTHWRQYKFGN